MIKKNWRTLNGLILVVICILFPYEILQCMSYIRTIWFVSYKYSIQANITTYLRQPGFGGKKTKITNETNGIKHGHTVSSNLTLFRSTLRNRMHTFLRSLCCQPTLNQQLLYTVRLATVTGISVCAKSHKNRRIAHWTERDCLIRRPVKWLLCPLLFVVVQHQTIDSVLSCLSASGPVGSPLK
jgi:hypothetical protein